MPATTDKNRLDLELIDPVLSCIHPGSPFFWSQGHSEATEKFRLLAHQMHRAKSKKPVQSVLITSAGPAEGKSTVALNLSGILARDGDRTLLIDADLRMPDLHEMLGIDSLPGLGEVLSGDLRLHRAIRRVDPLGLYFLPAGGRVENPVPLLESPNFLSVLSQAREAFEWVILDSPPFNPIADAQCIASLADGILLVVRWGVTPLSELEKALAALDGSPLLGMVINAFDDPQDSYYHSYYDRSKSLPALPSDPASIDFGKELKTGSTLSDQSHSESPTNKRG